MDGRGGRLGGLGVSAFGAVVGAGAQGWPPAIALTIAVFAWLTVDVGIWWWTHGKNAVR